MTVATKDPKEQTEAKPVMLRALCKRLRGWYMIGPGEAGGDLFWWDGNGKQPSKTEIVAEPTSEQLAQAGSPPKVSKQGPGGGPKRKPQGNPFA